MVDPVGPARRPSAMRRVGGRLTPVDGRRVDEAPSRLALPAPDVADEPAIDEAAGPAAFAAHVLGEGQRRGLKGGAETLERARHTYLETEWSGPSDRRLAIGQIKKAEV